MQPKIEVVSAEAHVKENLAPADINDITFNTITFKLSQDINGQEAYVYYTYKFDKYEQATVSATSDYSGTTITESNISTGE